MGRCRLAKVTLVSSLRHEMNWGLTLVCEYVAPGTDCANPHPTRPANTIA